MKAVFIIGFVITSAVAFFHGFKNGKERSTEQWESEIRYVTIEDIENITTKMRDADKEDDDIIVMIKPDWWENKS